MDDMKYRIQTLVKSLISTALLLIFSGSRANCQPVEHSSSAPMLGSYFDLIVSGNYESAGYLWNSAAQERSSKFGIQYENVPLKIDCTSPIVNNLAVMKDFLQPPIKRIEDLFDGKYQKLYFGAIVHGENVEHIYYAQFDGKNYWLTYPQDIYAGDWPVRESEYFRVHIHPDVEKFTNNIMFDEADRFVAQIGDSLGLTDMDLRHLQSTKIDFYYCASDEQVAQITGQRTRGVFDKGSSDIISSFFPHHHEVVHLLVDYRLRTLPLYTHPLFEEGLAVYYGGRWGKSTESLLPLGIYLYNEGLVSLDSLLSYNSFRNNAEAELAYPLAALFNRFMLEKLNKEKYFALYRKLSGSQQELSALPVDSVKNRISRALSFGDWDKLVAAFNEYLKLYQSKSYVVIPGNSGKGDGLIKGKSVVIKNDGDWLEFEFDAGTETRGNFLFGQVDKTQAGVSAMFAEQYGNEVPFEGYRYGVRFDSNEAGLYDYATNMLLAKYIAGVNPVEGYIDPQNHKVTFRIKKSLTNGVLPSENGYKLLNQ